MTVGNEGGLAIHLQAKKGRVGTFSRRMPRKNRKGYCTFSLVSALTGAGVGGQGWGVGVYNVG